MTEKQADSIDFGIAMLCCCTLWAGGAWSSIGGWVLFAFMLMSLASKEKVDE